MCTIKYYSHSFTAFLKVIKHRAILCKGEILTDLGVCEQRSQSPSTHYSDNSPTFWRGGGRGCFLSSTQTPSMKSRGQTDSCCCYFLSLGTSLMLQSQSPSREDGVSLRRGRGSRWVCVALHFLKCGRIFSDHRRRPYLRHHGPALHHVTAET